MLITLPKQFYGSVPKLGSAPVRISSSDAARRDAIGDGKMLLGGADESNVPSIFDAANIVPGIKVNRFYGYSDYLACGSKKVWATFRACDLIANIVLSTELKIAKDEDSQTIAMANTRRKGWKKTEGIKGPPELMKLLRSPNPHMSMSQLMYLWVFHMKLTGSAYWFLDEIDASGRPHVIYPINPRFMSIVPDKKTRIKEYVYTVNGKELHFDPSEIIHFRRPHPDNDLLGIGDIEAGESLFSEFINRASFNERFIENGAYPSSVLVNKTYDGSQEEFDAIKSKFHQQYGGAKNIGKTAWLNGDWNLLTLGITMAEMQDLEKSKVNVEQIFIHHGVPLSVAGFSNAANYATAKQDDIGMRRNACLPLIEMFCDSLNQDGGLVKRFASGLKLDFFLDGLVDVEQVGKDYGWLFDKGGITSNQLRIKAGLEPEDDPYMDQYYVTAAVVPVEMAGVTAPSAEDMALIGSGSQMGAQKPEGDGAGSAAGKPPPTKPSGDQQ